VVGNGKINFCRLQVVHLRLLKKFRFQEKFRLK
jgi:hypothetical protein